MRAWRDVILRLFSVMLKQWHPARQLRVFYIKCGQKTLSYYDAKLLGHKWKLTFSTTPHILCPQRGLNDTSETRSLVLHHTTANAEISLDNSIRRNQPWASTLI